MTVSASDYAPSGTIQLVDDVFLEGGPEFWFGGVAKYSPDSDGFYWGLTGTVANPAYKLGCYTNFRLRDAIQMSEVRCDTIGVVSSIQKRNYLEVDFTLMSLFPLAQTRFMLKGGPVTHNAGNHTEAMGMGTIDNNLYYLAFFSRVYDDVNGDFISVTGHRTQFVDVWEMAWTYGAPYTLGVKLRMYADTTKPAAQRFGTFLRYDPQRL